MFLIWCSYVGDFLSAPLGREPEYVVNWTSPRHDWIIYDGSS